MKKIEMRLVKANDALENLHDELVEVILANGGKMNVNDKLTFTLDKRFSTDTKEHTIKSVYVEDTGYTKMIMLVSETGKAHDLYSVYDAYDQLFALALDYVKYSGKGE